MPCKAMSQGFDSQNPDTPVPFCLSALAHEDLTDEPAFSLTPTGRAEIADAESIPLSALLKQRLEEFRAARAKREKARGKDLLEAVEAEDKAALLLAWTIDQAEAVQS